MIKKTLSGIYRKMFSRPGTCFLRQDKRLAGFEIGEWSHGDVRVVRWPKCGKLKIGKFCSIAEGTMILLGGEHKLDWVSTYSFTKVYPGTPDSEDWPRLKGDVIIGNDVWIGTNSLILSGVTIGDGAVVGAGSVVRKDIPPYGIVAGNPAMLGGFRFEKEVIEELLEMKWWNWKDEEIREALPYMLSTEIKKFIEKYRHRITRQEVTDNENHSEYSDRTRHSNPSAQKMREKVS